MNEKLRHALQQGTVIPAHPLALSAEGKLDERRQRALSRYYLAAGAGGLAVGVHTTQFAIRDPKVGLFKPVLTLAKEVMDRADEAADGETRVLRIGGVCGETAQAAGEAELLRDLGYHAGLLSLAAMQTADEYALIEHCRRVADVLPLIGFYLQPAVGGRALSYDFWRRFAEIKRVVAIKIAPFNRYQSLDVVRAVVDAGRDDIALYTGNDDHILLDLLTPYRFTRGEERVECRMVGGLLGQWAVWTGRAVELLHACRDAAGEPRVDRELLVRANELTDANAALFDAAHGFRGCIAGLHEVLRRQGLLEEVRLLDPDEGLSPGQTDEIDRVYRAYPQLHDDAFIAEHLDEWLG